jgi:hypothetical protein
VEGEKGRHVLGAVGQLRNTNIPRSSNSVYYGGIVAFTKMTSLMVAAGGWQYQCEPKFAGLSLSLVLV